MLLPIDIRNSQRRRLILDNRIESDTLVKDTLGSWWTEDLNGGTLVNTGDGITINAPAGSAHDVWAAIAHCNIYYASANHGAFDARVFVEDIPSTLSAWRGVHMYAWQDANDYVRWGRDMNASNHTNTHGENIAGTPANPNQDAVTYTSSVWLRFTFDGTNAWAFYTSADGGAWTQHYTDTQALTVNRIGFGVSNSGDELSTTCKFSNWSLS